MPCDLNLRKMQQARELMKKAKQAKTAKELAAIDKEIDKLDVCPEVKAHMREHLYAGVHA